MRRSTRLLALFAALALALAPALAPTLAYARAGGGSSFGSRGSRTYSAPPPTTTAPYSAAPMQRSLTQPAAPYGGYGTGGGYGRPYYRSGFGTGFMGGLIGAGIGGLLLGHGFFGGIGGFGSALGLIIQILLVVWLVRFLWRRFAGSGMAFAGSGYGASATPGMMPPSAPSFQVPPQDFQAFEQTLRDVQAAWTARDLRWLEHIATPEMVSYFAEQLADYASRGVHNSVTDVRLLKGDLAEAWREGNRDYATVAMRFAMIDVTTDASGRVVDGSPSEHATVTELWTFTRVQGGRWLLSAIQQAR